MPTEAVALQSLFPGQTMGGSFGVQPPRLEHIMAEADLPPPPTIPSSVDSGKLQLASSNLQAAACSKYIVMLRYTWSNSTYCPRQRVKSPNNKRLRSFRTFSSSCWRGQVCDTCRRGRLRWRLRCLRRIRNHLRRRRSFENEGTVHKGKRIHGKRHHQWLIFS